jgi:serine/threonine protein kinase
MEETALGQYRLIERLGAGGMGEVFLARLEREEGFKKLLVLKRILPDLSESSRFREMFSAEARIAAKLNHPHIIQVTDFGRIGRNCFLAMEYVEGADLATLLGRTQQRRIPVPIDFLCAVAMACLRALDYAHRSAEPVVHGDVSPSNVLVGREGEVKLADFGLARLAGSGAAGPAGEIRGKLCYMAPEVAFGQPAEIRSDVFGVGAILYEMICRVPPLARLSRYQDGIQQAQRCMIPKVDQVMPEAQPDLAGIIDRALSPGIEDRFENAAAMEESLARVVKTLGLDPGPRPVGTFVQSVMGEAGAGQLPDIPRTLVAVPAAKKKRRTRTLWIVFALLLAVATGGLAWKVFRSKPADPIDEDKPTPGVLEEPPGELPDGGPGVDASATLDAGLLDTQDAGRVAGPDRKPPRRRRRKRVSVVPAPDGGQHASGDSSPTPFGPGKKRPAFRLETNRPVKVSLDGVPESDSPLVQPDALLGTHILKVRDEQGLQATVRIESRGESGDLWFAFRSRPFAILSVDGNPKGLTPIGRVRLGRGSHVFTLAVPKHRPLVLRIRID